MSYPPRRTGGCEPFTGTRLSFRCSLIQTAVGHRGYASPHQRREYLVLDLRNHQLRPARENQGRAAKLAISSYHARHAFLLLLNGRCDCLSWMRIWIVSLSDMRSDAISNCVRCKNRRTDREAR